MVLVQRNSWFVLLDGKADFYSSKILRDKRSVLQN